MLQTVTTIVLIMMSISIFICFIRVVKGPTMSDRVVALDTIGINLIGFIGILMIIQKTVAYSEVILVIAIIAFIGSIAFAKFIEGGVVLDRDRR
ncbi:Na(+)/H(+) antiporter subunit F1 [Evansella sp. AB-P1]|uniref:Na(+)/H(+) antiporter subunit F1 n=1 Tax=Evansella sp. AB-P1 TaxID=3037653 RepID=UPI00241FF674|nr:Na(+)/H(+) antiporter subunit F1 [Evansella sp. AB-P1]MDG5786503.1 Na(+)/H(+) antiporter subunit F1 [Evansella sp. AB-P1]